jgi:hypothetical protein
MVPPRSLSEREHPFGSKEDFVQAFMKMQSMVEEMYKNRKKDEKGNPSGTTVKYEGVGGDPPKSLPSPSSSSSSSSSESTISSPSTS